MSITNNSCEILKTNIFLSSDKLRKRQITIIDSVILNNSLSGDAGEENFVKNNFMIIPVPNPNSVRFVNLAHYPKCFDDIEKTFNSNFPYVENEWLENKKNNFFNFKPFLCKNLNELKNLNPLEFGNVKNQIFDFFKKYYENCGFIILKLFNFNKKINYIPFAYTHNMASKHQLFFPLRSLEIKPRNIVVYSYNTNAKSGNCKVFNKKPYLDFSKIGGFEFSENISQINKFDLTKQNKRFLTNFENNDLFLDLITI